MSTPLRSALVALLLLPASRSLAAQTNASPTLPSDTLAANYAPRSWSGPMAELAPSLPSDTLDATRRVDSFPTNPLLDDPPTDSLGPAPSSSRGSPADSVMLRELQGWMDDHPARALPPVRAVLVRA